MKTKLLIGLLTGLGLLLVFVVIFFNTPAGRAAWNNYNNSMKEVDEATLYENKKAVEDRCRSMIASYKADKLTYETYKDSEDAVLKSSANQARIRANQTAASYNEYILKNKHIWQENVPSDIYMNLEYI